MKLSSADLETLSSAAAELDSLALDSRMCNSVGGPDNTRIWDDELYREQHDKLKRLAGKLLALRERAA